MTADATVTLRGLDDAIEIANDRAMRAYSDSECDLWLRRARRLERERETLLGHCHNCHGKGDVWDSSGECANRQSTRRCPMCGGTGRS